jgi:uncharacterized protein YjbJ (UPF0337 family)
MRQRRRELNGVVCMSTGDKIKHAGESAKGKVKEVAGAVADDDGLEAEGKGEQVAAKTKEHFNK